MLASSTVTRLVKSVMVVTISAPARNKSAAACSQKIHLVHTICWTYSLTQMGWLLRPFIGTPQRPFEWFRERDSNFLLDVVRTLGDLFR